MALRTPKGEVFYPNVFEKSEFSGKYDLVMRFSINEFDDKEKALWKELVTACDETARAKFGEGFKENKKLKSPFTKGDPDEKYFNDPESYYVKFSTFTRPSVVGLALKAIGEEDFYGGCIARVSCNPNAFDVQGSKGVNLYLNNIQKITDGERHGAGRTKAEDDFENEEIDDAAELFMD